MGSPAPIAIVDYRAGNLTSVRLAFEHLGVPAFVTSDPGAVERAERVVFPGVGAAGAAMANLREAGLIEAIGAVVRRGTPFLGICVGMQILFESSEEDGGVAGLGLVAGAVRLFAPSDPRDKVPHMGWNSVSPRRAHPLFDGIADGSEFYFVHSYYPAPSEPGCALGVTEYAGVAFASAVANGNLAATQFHPEKSGRIGLRLLRNFAAWRPGERYAPMRAGPPGSVPC
jgi:glutamine amidotransferase